jgi:hypothetical protein
MDPQTSDEPTLGNDQHFIYTKEHAPECMTQGPRAGRTGGPAAPPSHNKSTHNSLITTSWTKSQMPDHRQ